MSSLEEHCSASDIEARILAGIRAPYFMDPYTSTEKDLQFSVDSLGRFRLLRNAFTHTSHMPDDEIRKLRSDKWLVRLTGQWS